MFRPSKNIYLVTMSPFKASGGQPFSGVDRKFYNFTLLDGSRLSRRGS